MVDIRILEDWDYPTIVNPAPSSSVNKYYNYYTGQWVNNPDLIKPQAVAPLQDVGFMAAAAGATTPAAVAPSPTTAPTPTVSQPTTVFEQMRDVGFEDAARAAGQPFVPNVPQTITPSSIAEDTRPAKPAGVAGAEWVWENDKWVLKSATQTPLVSTPGGGLTPQPKDTSDKPSGESGDSTQFVEYEYSKDFSQRRAKFFDSKTGKFTFGEWEPNPKTKEDFDAEQARIAEEETKLNEKRDAFALVEATMRSYGFNEEELKEITDYIAVGLINPKLGSNQLLLQLRQLQSYKDRFAGNELRRAKGLNALSEAAYLQQERDYAQTLNLYGQNKFVGRQQFADLIGNDISNTELTQRVATAVNRLQNADPSVLQQLREYYPSISEQDIVSYFLSPDQALPELEVKTTTAEIGATARQYGLDYGMGRATELQQYGVDLERARTGFGNIARVLPRTQDLAAFYQEAGIDYNQQMAEEEEFKGLASARRARERLKEIETATFSGQAGTTRGALGRSSGGAF